MVQVMIYYGAEVSPGIWAIFADYRDVGGADIRICAALDEHTAKGTALALNMARVF